MLSVQYINCLDLLSVLSALYVLSCPVRVCTA